MDENRLLKIVLESELINAVIPRKREIVSERNSGSQGCDCRASRGDRVWRMHEGVSWWVVLETCTIKLWFFGSGGVERKPPDRAAFTGHRLPIPAGDGLTSKDFSLQLFHLWVSRGSILRYIFTSYFFFCMELVRLKFIRVIVSLIAAFFHRTCWSVWLRW